MKMFKVTVDCPASVGERKSHLMGFVVMAENAEQAKAEALKAPMLEFYATPSNIYVTEADGPVCFMHDRF